MLPARLLRMAKRGEVPAVFLPDNEVRFDPTDLAAWVETYKRPGADTETSPTEETSLEIDSQTEVRQK